MYFLAESTSSKQQLQRFSQALGFFARAVLQTRGFASWEEVFAYLKAKNEQFILAIDEYCQFSSFPGGEAGNGES